MVVYGDLLFLINFSMDFLCFYISCFLLHRKLPLFRVCLSATVGGVYSVISLFLNADKNKSLIMDLFVLVLMCLTVYLDKYARFGRMIKGIFLYFFVSALLGGLMTALFSVFNKVEIFAKDMGMGESIDVWIFSILAIVGSIITLRGGRIFKTSMSKKTARVEIESESGKVELHALVDSGNLAIEPISGKSVVFVSVEKCKNIIEEQIYNHIKHNSNISIDLISKIRMIPTQSVSGKSFLPGLKFKNVIINFGKTRKNIDVYVALVDQEVLGEYDAIISDETII